MQTLKLEVLRKELPTTCQILAVSKLQAAEKIRELWSQGQVRFAENYVQEALEKQEQLRDLKIEWHFIGRLQKNKVKLVVGNFELIHSVDSFELAKAINEAAQKLGKRQKILIQLNLAQEQSKGGLPSEELPEVLNQIKALNNIQVIGLMTMPPLFENAEDSRPYFIQLRSLLEQQKINFPSLQILSMGTSSDFRVAAESGSTLVRLGTILFGERIK